MEQILEIKSINKDYPNFHLNINSINIKEGEVVGLIGENGSGKTTILEGIKYFARENNLFFYGSPLKNNNADIAFLKIWGGIYGDLSISSFFDIFGSTYQKWDKKLCDCLVKKYHINVLKKISTLSVGQTAQVYFIFTLCQNAKLLLLDEPTSGLDPFVREEMNNDLKQYVKNKENVGVIYSSHIISDIEKVASRVILIKNGKLLLDESLKTLKTNYFIVDEIFLNSNRLHCTPIVQNKYKQYVVKVKDDFIKHHKIEKYRTNLEDIIFNLYGEKYDKTI